jgi:hypothetical protein
VANGTNHNNNINNQGAIPRVGGGQDSSPAATKPGGFADLIKTGEGGNFAQDSPIKEKVQATTEYKTFVSAIQF